MTEHTEAIELAAANWTVELNGWTPCPNKVMSMFMVTVPLVEAETGGTAKLPVASWAVTGPPIVAMGAGAAALRAAGALAAGGALLPYALQLEDKVSASLSSGSPSWLSLY